MTSSDQMLLEKVDDPVKSDVLPDEGLFDNCETSIPSFRVRPDLNSTSDLSVWPVTSEFEDWATADCIEFCNSHGLIDALRQCLKHIELIFHNYTRLFAELSFCQDDDTDDVGHIVIRVDVKSERDIVRAEKNEWLDWFISNLAPDKRLFINVVVKRDDGSRRFF